MKKNSNSKRPAFMFYVNDWMLDEQLQMCSLKSQGLWIALMCIMHKAKPYGTLTINGINLDKNTTKKLINCDENDFNFAWDELRDWNVLKEKNGRFYSKRMVNDYKIQAIRAEAGKQGGIKTQENFAKAKTQANTEQNAEYESEDENETNIYKTSSKDFLSVWGNYPNKVGKKAAQRHFKATVKTEKDFENINKALSNYLKSKNVLKGFIQNGSTWFNDWDVWVEYADDTVREGFKCPNGHSKGIFMKDHKLKIYECGECGARWR